MLPDELKCLEVLIRYITDTKSMDKQARSEFDSISAFEYAKTNLFALVTISILIENYHKHPSFSLESFLENGAIEGRFNTPIVGPTIDVEYRDNYKGFYFELIKALKEGNYTFDNENNIIVSSEKIETIISLEWLFRLAEGFKKETYKRVYFYNKNFENDITDKIMDKMNADIVTGNRTKEIYTVYGYSEEMEDYVVFGSTKTNVNVAITYDELNNETLIYMATPIINQDF